MALRIDLHWNEEEKMYCDVGVNNDGMDKGTFSATWNHCTEHLSDESYHVCHRGYLSLFPLMLGVLPPNSTHLGPIIEMLHDPKQLWSPYGIRSLSASHPDFGQGENYWKGPIWIQMNYLVLKALHEVCSAFLQEQGQAHAHSFIRLMQFTKAPSRTRHASCIRSSVKM
jgi:mannosyl-oligosaccharide glucosidase